VLVILRARMYKTGVMMGSVGMICIPNFITIGSVIREILKVITTLSVAVMLVLLMRGLIYAVEMGSGGIIYVINFIEVFLSHSEVAGKGQQTDSKVIS
jgi:hypothetical protein